MLEPSEILDLLIYDRDTGRLSWKHRENETAGWNGKYAGKEAFTSVDAYGYRQGSIRGRRMLAHRVIMAMETGSWPEEDVDHINGDRQDNRFCNLRNVSRSENCMNSSIGKRNKSGAIGVSWSSRDGKWRAQIQKDGKNFYIGIFDDLEDAKKARLNKEKELGFHKNHGKS